MNCNDVGNVEISKDLKNFFKYILFVLNCSNSLTLYPPTSLNYLQNCSRNTILKLLTTMRKSRTLNLKIY